MSILNKPFRWWCNRKFEEVSEKVRVGGKAAEVLSEAEAERHSENYRGAIRKLKRAKELAKRENPYLERKERYEKALSDSRLFSSGSDTIQSRLENAKESIRNGRYEEAEKELNEAEKEMRRVLDSAVKDVFDLREEGLSNFVEGEYEKAAERWREATRKFEVIAGFGRSGIEFGSETDFERSPEEYVDEARVLTDLAELGADVYSGSIGEVRDIRSETRKILHEVDEEKDLNSVEVSEWGRTDSDDFRDQVRRIRNEYRALREGGEVGQEAGTTTVRSSSSVRDSRISRGETSSETGSETEASPHTPASEDDETDSTPVRSDAQPRDRRGVSGGNEQHEIPEESGASSGSVSSESKSCPECGKDLEESVVFCTGCGTKTEGDVEDEYEGEDDSSPEDGVAEPEEESSAPGGRDRTESGSEATQSHAEGEPPATDTADASHESLDATSDTHIKEGSETEADNNKSCPDCGDVVDEGNSFCTSCGADLEKPSEDTGAVCPECGGSVDEDDGFCTSCGADLGKPSKDAGTVCPECGGSINEDDSFCTSCGTALQSS